MSLGKAYTNVILVPYIQQGSTDPRSSFVISDNSIKLRDSSRPSSGDFMSSLTDAIGFLTQRLPPSISKQAGELVIMVATSHLLSDYLLHVVPADMGGVPAFQGQLHQVATFASNLEALVPRTSRPLMDWVSSAPNLWLARRSASSLDSVRQVLKRGLGGLRAVERVETQVISSEDAVFAAAGTDAAADEDWNAAWDEDSVDENRHDAEASNTRPSKGREVDQDDDDNWDFDKAARSHKKPEESEEDDAGEAWGWGDDEEPAADATTAATSSASNPAASVQTNGRPKKQHAKSRAGKTVTLRETYHITVIPEQILEIVIMAIEDAQSLSKRSVIGRCYRCIANKRAQ